MKIACWSSKRRIFPIAVLIVHIFMRNFIWILPSALMPKILADMGITYLEGGMMLYVVTLMMGVFLFVGSMIIDRIGAAKAMVLSMLFFSLDGILSMLFYSFVPVLIGRVCSGIGYGLSASSFAALIAAWFDQRQYGMVNSINNALNSFSLMLAFVVIEPFGNILGSWRKELVLWSGISLVCSVLFYIWGRKDGNNTTRHPVSGVKIAESLARAIKYKEVKYFAAAMVGGMWVYTSLSSYLPVFLTEFYSLPTQSAGAITSMMPLAGMIGGILAGFLYGKTVSKKVLAGGLMLLTLAGASGVALFMPGFLQYLCIALVGFGFNGWVTTAMTTVMRLPDMTPSVASGSIAVMSGTSSLVAFFIPYVFDLLQKSIGMASTFLLFSLFLIPASLCMIRLPARNSRSAIDV